MKCHYEVLELERDATGEEIKKARDRLAKKYHPDKALQGSDPASVQDFTAKFRLIQQAYEVLSDAHEKAWYDTHREQILSSGSTVKEDIDIYSFFNTSCYSGYADDSNGFYAVFQRVFEKISEQDIRIAEADKEEFDVPSFGNSKSSYEEVVNPFYGFWQSYSTKRKFFAQDKWDLRTADNRRIARAMEKENKKERDAMKREWNDSVRELTSFIRKRDPRVKAYRKLLEEKAIEAQQRVKLLQEQQRLQRQELLKAGQADYNATEMEKHYRQLERNLGHETDETEDSDAEDIEIVEEDDDPLYCIGCDKRFKSVPAMRNHLNSKQHKKNIELLRSELAENDEEAELLKKLDKMELNAVVTQNLPDTSSIPDVDETFSKSSPKKDAKAFAPPVDEEETVILATESEVVEVEEYTSRNKAKKNKAVKNAKQKIKDLGLKCSVCKEVFSTRNKLFQHIKDEGHAAAPK